MVGIEPYQNSISTNKLTKFFREWNLFELVDLLRNQPLAVVGLVGASFEELVSIATYARRFGLTHQRFIGYNNSLVELARYHSLIESKQGLSFNARVKNIEYRGFTEQDLAESSIRSTTEYIELDGYTQDLFALGEGLLAQIEMHFWDPLLDDHSLFEFDAVVINNVLTHYNPEDQYRILLVISGSIRPNGYLVRDRCNVLYGMDYDSEADNAATEAVISKGLPKLRRINEHYNIYQVKG